MTASTHHDIIAPLLFIGGIPLMIGFWCLICLLLASIGGWKRLASKYAASHPPTCDVLRMESGYFGSIKYKGCLTVAAMPRGLYLAVFPIFRPGHPSLLIPWDQIRDVEAQTALFCTGVRFSVGAPALATLTLSGRVHEGMKRHLH